MGCFSAEASSQAMVMGSAAVPRPADGAPQAPISSGWKRVTS